jgi:hypothetical protein
MSILDRFRCINVSDSGCILIWPWDVECSDIGKRPHRPRSSSVLGPVLGASEDGGGIGYICLGEAVRNYTHSRFPGSQWTNRNFLRHPLLSSLKTWSTLFYISIAGVICHMWCRGRRSNSEIRFRHACFCLSEKRVIQRGVSNAVTDGSITFRDMDLFSFHIVQAYHITWLLIILLCMSACKVSCPCV